jgi:hypothetical protein
MRVRFSDSEQWSSPVKPPRSDYVKPHNARTRVRVGKVLAGKITSSSNEQQRVAHPASGATMIMMCLPTVLWSAAS